jgi:hypothetical protein
MATTKFTFTVATDYLIQTTENILGTLHPANQRSWKPNDSTLEQTDAIFAQTPATLLR